MFNILDSPKLKVLHTYPSWVHAECPVCGGNLKINTTESKYGAYACYTNECHTKTGNPVRKALITNKSSFNRPSSFESTAFSKRKLQQVIKPLHLADLTFSNFYTNVEYIPPTIIRDEDIIFKFEYPDFTSIRIEKQPKIFYNEYIDEQGLVKRGVPETLTGLPIYHPRYIQKSLCIVEGEKCAAVLQKIGIAAISLASFAYSDNRLDDIFYKLHKDVNEILILQDNDSTGINKARKILLYSSKYKIPGCIINPANTKNYMSIPGFDIFDLIRYEKLFDRDLLAEVLLSARCK